MTGVVPRLGPRHLNTRVTAQDAVADGNKILPSAAPDSGWIQIFAFLVFVIFLFPININRVATQYVYERKMISRPEPGSHLDEAIFKFPV